MATDQTLAGYKYSLNLLTHWLPDQNNAKTTEDNVTNI